MIVVLVDFVVFCCFIGCCLMDLCVCLFWFVGCCLFEWFWLDRGVYLLFLVLWFVCFCFNSVVLSWSLFWLWYFGALLGCCIYVCLVVTVYFVFALSFSLAIACYFYGWFDYMVCGFVVLLIGFDCLFLFASCVCCIFVTFVCWLFAVFIVLCLFVLSMRLLLAI